MDSARPPFSPQTLEESGFVRLLELAQRVRLFFRGPGLVRRIPFPKCPLTCLASGLCRGIVEGVGSEAHVVMW